MDEFEDRMINRFVGKLTAVFPTASFDKASMKLTTSEPLTPPASLPAGVTRIIPYNGMYIVKIKPLFSNTKADTNDKTKLEKEVIVDELDSDDQNVGQITIAPVSSGGRKSRRNRRVNRRKQRKARTTRRR